VLARPHRGPPTSINLTAGSTAPIVTAALCSHYADRNLRAYLITAIRRRPGRGRLAGWRVASHAAGQSSPVGRSQSWRMLS